MYRHIVAFGICFGILLGTYLGNAEEKANNVMNGDLYKNKSYYVSTKDIQKIKIDQEYFAPDFSRLVPIPVERVVDGDTIKVQMNGETKTIRLVGVDTPETVHPKKGVQPYGKEASNFTKNLLAGEQIYFVTDSKNNKLDKYGRLLGYVYRFPDGLFVNLELIRQGYAKAYTVYPFDYKWLFKFYEETATRNEKGFWKK